MLHLMIYGISYQLIASLFVDPHFCHKRGIALLSCTPLPISVVLPDVNNAVEESGKIDKKKEGYGKVEEDELAIGDMVVHEAGLDSDLWIETRLAGRGRLEWKCDLNWLMLAPAI